MNHKCASLNVCQCDCKTKRFAFCQTVAINRCQNTYRDWMEEFYFHSSTQAIKYKLQLGFAQFISMGKVNLTCFEFRAFNPQQRTSRQNKCSKSNVSVIYYLLCIFSTNVLQSNKWPFLHMQVMCTTYMHLMGQTSYIQIQVVCPQVGQSRFKIQISCQNHTFTPKAKFLCH